jgi:hypothetical protein
MTPSFLCGPQLEPAADRVRPVGLRHRLVQGVMGQPAGAVGGHDELWPFLGQRRHRRRERRAVAQVQPSGHQVDLVDAGEPLRLADDVDDAGVAAPGDDQESPAADVRHQRLVFMDQRVVPPLAIHPCLVTCRQAGLERRRARHLAGDQQHAAEQERRLPVLDQGEAGVLDGRPAWRR